MPTEDNIELLIPQIAWHEDRSAIQSVDTSPASGLLATGGSDNEVRLWRLSREGVVSFVQSLTGHTKARTPGAPNGRARGVCDTLAHGRARPAFRSLSTLCASARSVSL
jgi:WD40 repeat protein